MKKSLAKRIACVACLVGCMVFARHAEALLLPLAYSTSIASASDLRDSKSLSIKSGLAKGVSVDDFGARGNDSLDDTFAIQSAVDYCYTHGIHVLSFSKGQTYLMSSSKSQNSIVLYDSHIVLEGNGATILAKSQVAGYFGAVIDIGGLIRGKTYPGLGRYTGTTRLARNIVVRNLTIRHEIFHTYVNSIGIHNVDGVLIQNVKVINSPQTGFAIVADTKDHPVSNVVLERCEVWGSGRHAFRISLQGSANTLTVSMDHCLSGGVRGPEIDKETRGEHVQVWYRAAGHGGDVSLTITNSKFDRSGVILANMGSRNLILKNNDIGGGVVLRHGRRDDIGFRMLDNRIGPEGVKDFRAPPAH